VTTIHDVARRAGVSAGTVSNVLNRPSYVNPETRARVDSAIKELGYTPRSASRRYRPGRMRTFGMVVVDLGIPFFVDVALGADAEARALGASLVICTSDDDTRIEEHNLDVLVQQRVQGVLIAPVDENNPRLEAMLERGIPVVFLDRTPALNKCCSVATSDLGGGRLAGRHLIERGHQRLAFVGDPAARLQMGARYAGFVEAARSAEVELLRTASWAMEAGHEVGREIASREESRRPTGIFCANDQLALGVLHELLAASIRVPEDIALVGYDDIPWVASAAVPLTTVRQERAELGRTAVRLLMAEADEGSRHRHQHVLLEAHLVVRASSGVDRRRTSVGAVSARGLRSG
jgi:LacI family transcriptional regulator